MRIASLVSFIALAGTTLAGQYKKNLVVDGPNPSHVGFNLYEPSVVKPNAPVVVGLHWCGGSADAANSGYGLNKWADQYGFVVIYPDTPHSSRCWDVNTAASLKHEAGGDSLGIVSMVKQVIKKYNADAGRVFTAGFSSGAMMTQVLLGAYPDVFTAGAANSGVPFACCASNEAGGSCAGCGAGNHDGKGWGDIVRNAYPGYSGWRPHVQLIHGSGDSLLNYNLLDAEIKQWTNVLGISSTPVTTEQNTPKIRWTKTVYGKGEVVAYGVEWAGHSSFAFDEDVIEKFFDLACPAGDASCFRRGGSSPTNPPSPQPTPSSSQPTPTTSKPAPTPAPTSSSPGAAMWGQCGGNNWNGPTTCAQGRCVKLNDWYYQCQ